MEDYIVQHWEGISALIITMGMLIRAWWQRRAEANRLKLDNARLENEKKQGDTTTLDVALKGLSSALASIEIIQADRIKLTDQLIALSNKLDTVEDQARKDRADAEAVNAQMGAELVKLRGELATAKGKISTLERELEARDIKIREQEAKLVLLTAENERLKCDLDMLQAKVNGKQDKPKTDELPALEPGEHNDRSAEAPETNEVP